MKLSTMKIFRLATIFLLISSFNSVLSHPSRPLNERSTELAWQAWLLVDDQNQNKQNDPENMMRRKVIAKSVFIAPTFSPEKLPPCADGYMSDSMGRCVKWVQLDHDANLDFLLQKLTGQFGNIGDDSDDKEPENLPTAGPVQFNIPFTEDSQEDVATSGENSDFAIIVSQTNTRPNKRDENKSKKDPNLAFVVAPTNGSFDPAKLNIKNEEKNSEDTETTIATIITTETETATEPTTEQVFSTTSNSGDEDDTSTIYTYPETTTKIEVETTYSIDVVDDRHQQALFFKIPQDTKPQHVENGTRDTPANADAISIGSRIKFDEEPINNDEPIAQDSTNIHSVSSKVIFRDSASDDELLSNAGDLVTSENVRHAFQKIRFPDVSDGNDRYADLPNHQSGENTHQISQFKRPQRQNQKPTKLSELLDDLRHTANVFENTDSHVGQTDHGLDPETENHHRLHGHRVRLHPNLEYRSNTSRNNEQRQIFNRRNRDKNFWRLTPTWRESSPQKTLVLRFSNISSNFARGNFYRHNVQNAEPVYRQLPLEDLSYIFGHKRKHTNHR